jgi:DNA-binding NtrC family response regulator
VPITVVLAVGLDPWLLAAHGAAWRSANYIVIPADTIKEAIDHFKSGDFDLVLLGSSIAAENKERLTSLIRASGSRTPVVCVANSLNGIDLLQDAALRSEPGALLAGLGEILAETAKMRRGPATSYGNAS